MMNYSMQLIALIVFYVRLSYSIDCNRRSEGSCYKNFASGQVQKIERNFDDSLTLNCPQVTESDGKESNIFEWTFDGKDISAGDSLEKMISWNEDLSILKIDNLKVEDGGKYKCKIKNSKQVKSSSYNVKVIHAVPKITSEIDANYYIERGTSKTINCEATGVPAPKIMWTKDGSEINFKDSNGTLSLGLNNELIINTAVLENTGIYTCIAKNAIHDDKKTADILITIKPKILITEPNWYLVRWGNPFSVDCKLAEEPIPATKAAWKKIKEGVKFENEERKDYIGTRLVLEKTNENHDGKYACVAENIAGEDHWNIEIHVCDNATFEHCGDRLNSSHPILYTQFRMFSSDRQYALKMQDDRNLVIYKAPGESHATWHTDTNDHKNIPLKNELHMLTDGDLQLFDATKKTIWNSMTELSKQPTKHGKLTKVAKTDGPMEFIMQNDGNLHLIGTDNDWQSVNN